LVRKAGFCISQVISGKDRLQNDLQSVEWDVKPYYTYIGGLHISVTWPYHGHVLCSKDRTVSSYSYQCF